MATLEELQKENERLRKMQTKLKEMRKNNEDREELLKQNKKLLRDIKHGKKIRFAKAIGRDMAHIGRISGKGFLKVGKGAFKGLQRYAIFLQEQERKQRSSNRRLKKVVRRKIKGRKR